MVDDISEKMKNVKDDPRRILALNIGKISADYDRLRNVSLLLAFMEKENINIDPFFNRIKQELNKIKNHDLKPHQKQYKDYLLEKIQESKLD